MNFLKMRNTIFFGFLFLVTAAFLFLFKPFFYPIFWAAVIASIFYPLYQKIKEKIKLPRLSAAIVMLLVLLIIVIPLAGVSSLLVKESVDLYEAINNNSSTLSHSVQSFFVWVQNHPIAQEFHINQTFWIEKFSEFTKAIASFVVANLTVITQTSFVFLAMFVLMFYTLYFFLRDGEKFLKMAMHLCPLGDAHEKMLYEKFTSTALATLKSSLVVGGIQGVLSGLLFYIAGVQGAAIWGLITVFLCIIPIGSGFVWGPIGIVLLITGNTWQGLLVLFVGVLVISTIDNLLRPVLIGKKTEMHPLLILFSTLGGLLFFGLTGFIIGPVIASLLVAFWEMYDDFYKKELENN
jgi:predicted PurR-regulated permease PerM